MTSAKTPSGATIRIGRDKDQTLVYLSAETVPEEEIGRVVMSGSGFQPAPFSSYALTPGALRVIADLIEGATP